MGNYLSNDPNEITEDDKKIYDSTTKRSFKASSYEDAVSMVLKGEEMVYVGRFVFSKISKRDIDKLIDIAGDRELVMVEDGPHTDRYFDLYMIRGVVVREKRLRKRESSY